MSSRKRSQSRRTQRDLEKALFERPAPKTSPPPVVTIEEEIAKCERVLAIASRARRDKNNASRKLETLRARLRVRDALRVEREDNKT